MANRIKNHLWSLMPYGRQALKGIQTSFLHGFPNGQTKFARKYVNLPLIKFPFSCYKIKIAAS